MKTCEDIYSSFLEAKCEFYGNTFLPFFNWPPKAEPDSWVVKKTGAKRASKIFKSEEDAKEYIKARRGKGLRKYIRKGKKFPDEYMKTLKQLSIFFNTKWSSIDVKKYFLCGFELFNSQFSYINFFDQRIIKLYIERDKLIKRKAELNKRNIIESVKFVKKYITENNIRNFSIYCLVREDGKCLPVTHYLDNKIDRYFLAWLLREKMIHLTDYEFSVIPYITDKYRDILEELKEINHFLKAVKEKL